MTVLRNRAVREALDAGKLVIDPRPPDQRIGTSAIDLTLAGELRRWRTPTTGMEHIIDPSVAGFSFQRAVARWLPRCPICHHEHPDRAPHLATAHGASG